MSHVQLCSDQDFLNLVAPEEKVEYARKKMLYLLGLEITNFCGGSCAYCFSSSDTTTDSRMPRQKVLELIDEGAALQVRELALTGGDALTHPHWEEFAAYGAEKGMRVAIGTSFLISRELARRLCRYDVSVLCSHIDTLDPEAYAQVHTNPKTLEAKIRGLYNLLEAGFPRERIAILITLTRPILSTLERTIDWYVDELGIKYIAILAAKGVGFGVNHQEWEPGLSDFRRAHEYRARKLGSHFLRIGVGDLGKFFCQTYFQVHFDGHVSPCNTLRELSVGNVYQESLTGIFEKHRDFLLHHHEIKGKCGDCENNDVCFGCRANAFYYLGDVQSSDPKCWLNPAAPEYCYAINAD